jgi:hypothetical protein
MSTDSRRNAARQTETIALWGGGAVADDDHHLIHVHCAVPLNKVAKNLQVAEIYAKEKSSIGRNVSQ